MCTVEDRRQSGWTVVSVTRIERLDEHGKAVKTFP
jgi:hypothetical protein